MRVLILYLSVGSGHKVAAESLKKALELKDKSSQVNCVDLVTSTNSTLLSLLPDIYKATLGIAPNLYDSSWDSDILRKGYSVIDDSLLEVFAPRIEKVIEKMNPDIIVSTHVVGAKIADFLKRRGRFTGFNINIVTDFGVHPYWFTKTTDEYIVPSESVKEELVNQGGDKDQIHATGIPIGLEFAENAKDTSLPKDLKISKKNPNVLFIFGGGTLGPYSQVARLAKKILIKTMEEKKTDYRITVVVGKNKPLEKRIRSLKLPINLLTYIDYMPSLLKSSSLVIAKPGGLITSEALASGLPFVILGKPVGQERRNANFLIREGAGVKLINDLEIPRLINTLFEHPARLKFMKERAKKLGKPNSAVDAADIVINADI